MLNKKMQLPFFKTRCQTSVLAGCLVTSLVICVLSPRASFAGQEGNNPRGDFPGRLEGGGSRKTTLPTHLSPFEGLEAEEIYSVH
ncbi:MAG: hypothetical protein AAFR31_11270 [Cyanobacteria bacterium J06627_8]